MIHLNSAVIHLLNEEATHNFPYECCGFLLGFETKKNRFISEIYRVENSAKKNKKRRFEIAPLDYIKVENYAEKQGLTLLGIYHSHPNYSAIPSEHDRIAAQTYFSYVIIGVEANHIKDIRSWKLNELHQFEEEEIGHNKEIKNFKIKNLWLQL